MGSTPVDKAPMQASESDLRDMLSDSISEELGSFVKSRSSTFVCGGSVPIELPNDNASASKDPYSPPIVIRWDSPESDTGIAKISFPVDAWKDAEKASLAKLIQNCQPASFGYKGEDVLDESYRKATKMDRSVFSTDFCPYELGIIDTIAQVLLPNAGGRVGSKGVKAELYKLNIYAAPSGFFKAHVDTPRSETQFGSLVVSLPCGHEGGQLNVRHAEHSVTFDWSMSGSLSNGTENYIQWAAFYNDCEHEVLEVTEGHRITLTYNLYYASGLGDLAGNSPVMDVKSLPLYKKVQEALAEPSFMYFGGYLGIYLQHAYAHSTPEGSASLPSVLKGSDMAVYSVFRALGLQISVRPILDHKSTSAFDNYLERQDDMDWDEEKYESVEDMDDRDRGPFVRGDLVGKEGKQLLVTEVGGCEEGYDEICAAWGGELLKVKWVTEKKWKNMGMVHLAYGNQAGIDCMYTYAALLVTVPPASGRSKETAISVE